MATILTSERITIVPQILTGISAALAIHLHYFCVALIWCSLCAAIFTDTPIRAIRKLLLSSIILMLLTAPIVWPVYLQMSVYKSYAWIPPASLLTLYTTLFLFSSSSFVGTVLFLVLIYSSSVLPIRPINRPALLCHPILSLFALIPLVSVPASCFLAAQVGIQVLHPRYMFFLFVPFLFLIVLGLLPFSKVARLSLLLLLCCLLGKPSAYLLANTVMKPKEVASEMQSKSGVLSVHLDKTTYIEHAAKQRFPGNIKLLNDGATSNIFKFPTVRESTVLTIEELQKTDQFSLYIDKASKMLSRGSTLSEKIPGLESYDCLPSSKKWEEPVLSKEITILECFKSLPDSLNTTLMNEGMAAIRSQNAT